MDVELEQLKAPDVKPGPSEASLEIEGEDTFANPKPDGSEEEKKSQEEDSKEENSEESDDDDSSSGDDETDSAMLLEDDIIDAIKKGERGTVEQWLKKEETKVNEFRGGTASHGHFYVTTGTALHWAAYYGQLEIAKLLIEHGADPRQRARWEETVLLWACQCLNKNEELLKLLLTSTAPDGPADEQLVNLSDYNGWTPLHYACYDNNKEFVQQLLEAGADPTARNDHHSTPLDLLDKNSDDKMLDLLDKDRLLPRSSDPSLGEHIIEAIKTFKEDDFRKWLDRESEEVNHYRGDYACGGGFEVKNGTALHWAAYYGNFEIANLLIEKGADPRVLNRVKGSVLHWACQSQKENEEFVKLILDRKQVDVNFADGDGNTALHYACMQGYRNIAEQLLGAKADITARNRNGETPVDSAHKSGKKEMIGLMDKDRLLPRDDDPKLPPRIRDSIKNGSHNIVREWLQKKPDLNRCRGGKVESGPLEVTCGTALHWAAFYGKIEIAKLLLENDANPHMRDNAGETVLHWACKSEQENDEMVILVLDKIADAEDAERKVNAINSRGCTALHYACWNGHQKVAETLKKAKADPFKKSSAGYTPLDFAFVVARSNGVVEMLDIDHQLPREDNPDLEEDIVQAIKKGDRGCVDKWLKREHHNVNRSRGGCARSLTGRDCKRGTALHWAAYYGQQDIAKLLIDNSADPRARAEDNGTALHWACNSDNENRELVRLLLNKDCKSNARDEAGKVDARDGAGNTPIHLAASQGHQRIVEELIQRHRFCVKHRVLSPEEALKAKENTGPTPLGSASQWGHHDVVKLLVKKGAKVEPQDLKTAIEKGNERVVSDLLQSPQWPTLMRQCWGKTTPFRELIKKMPDVAKQVLDRCVVSDPSTRDPKNKEFAVAFDYSFVEEHQERRARSSPEEDNEPKVYPEDKKKAHTTRYNEIRNQPQTNFTTKYGPPFKKSNHPLAIMVSNECLDLLTHPVISSLLHRKWFLFGLWGYLLNLLVYVTFLVFLTSFALVVLNPQSSTCMQVLGNPGIAVCEQNGTAGNGSEMMANGTTGEGDVTCVTCELSDTRLQFVFAAAVIVILLAVLRLLFEASQFYYQPKNYLTDWVNWIEVSLYILSIIFVSVFRTTCLCPEGWQWQVGVMAILLAWIDLIVISSKFPSIGIYVIMFAKIVGTFLKVVFISILLVVTFGLTLHMTFSEPQLQRSPFAPPGIAFLKIMSMTAGDFSFDTVFRHSPSGESEGAQEILFPPISYILWIIFVILMPVLFTNLLVGLAVGDTQKIEQEAKLRKLALQVELILTAEHLLRFTGSHKRFISGRLTVQPNLQTEIEDDLDEFEEEVEEGELGSCFSACLRCIVSILYVFKEFTYQLWGGERYDTLENLQKALSSQLDSNEVQKEDSESEDQKEKPKEEAQHVEALGNMERMMSQMVDRMEMMSERMEALEELIKETSAKKGGGEGSDSKRESEVGGDSEPEGSEDESDSDN